MGSAADASVNVLFILGFGPIVRDRERSRKLYGDVAGIRFEEESGGYLHSENVPGANTLRSGRSIRRRCLASDGLRGRTTSPLRKRGSSSTSKASKTQPQRLKRAAIGCL